MLISRIKSTVSLLISKLSKAAGITIPKIETKNSIGK